MTIGCDDPSARLGQIALDAELAGLPWVARLSRGLGEAVLVALGSPAWRVTACTDLLVECERTGDDWGAALLQLATAIACQLADSGRPTDQFADAARRFQRLDAPVLALWAQALQACVLAREGADGAGEFAHRVATGARALQSGGVHALALAALAVAAGGERRPARIVVGDAAAQRGRPRRDETAHRWCRHRKPLHRRTTPPSVISVPDAAAGPRRAPARRAWLIARRPPAGGAVPPHSVLRRLLTGDRRSSDGFRPAAATGQGTAQAARR